jgi:hypothetical protein
MTDRRAEREPAARPRSWIWAWRRVVFAAELPFAHAAAFVMCVFITIFTVGHLDIRIAAPITIGLALAALLVPVAMTSWHDGLIAAFDTVTPVAIPVSGLSVFGSLQMVRGQTELAEARPSSSRTPSAGSRRASGSSIPRSRPPP